MKIYKCYENGRMIMKGTASQIADFLGIPCPSTVGTYAKYNRIYYKRYTFEETGENYKALDFKNMNKRKEPTKHESDLEYLRVNLTVHGNSSHSTDGREFVQELAKCGIRFKAELMRDKKAYLYKRIYPLVVV